MQAMEEELKMLRSGVAALLHDTTPVPRANVQLRRFCGSQTASVAVGRSRAAASSQSSRRAVGFHSESGWLAMGTLGWATPTSILKDNLPAMHS